MPTFFGVLEHRRVLSADPAGVSEADVLAASQEAYEVVVVDQTATLDVRMTEVTEAVAVVEAFATADVVPSEAVLTAMIELFEATTTLSADTEVDAATRAELDLLLADLSAAAETIESRSDFNDSGSSTDGDSRVATLTAPGDAPGYPGIDDWNLDGRISNVDFALTQIFRAAYWLELGYFRAAWEELKQVPNFINLS